MAQLTDAQKAAMGGPEQVPEVGDAWTASSPFVAADGLNLVAVPAEDVRVVGVNSPAITSQGWRRMVRRMLAAKGS